jgi:uncharacterized protein
VLEDRTQTGAGRTEHSNPDTVCTNSDVPLLFAKDIDVRIAQLRRTRVAQDVWINLPVGDLAKSILFYTEMGFTHTPGPGNTAHSASFTIGEKKVVLMLFSASVFSGFTSNPVSDPTKGTEVLFSLGADNRAQVDSIARRASTAGGKVFREPAESNGFMYGCGLLDPDGHRWNALYMDTIKMPK